VHIGGTVLQQAENRLTASVERHHLSVDYSFIRQLLQCCHNAGIAFSEVLVVAGPEPDLSAGLDRQRPIAVELDLVPLAVALGQLVGPQQEHRSINRAVRSALGTIKGWHKRYQDRHEPSASYAHPPASTPAFRIAVSQLAVPDNSPASSIDAQGTLLVQKYGPIVENAHGHSMKVTKPSHWRNNK
jgi:hypothetical protein